MNMLFVLECVNNIKLEGDIMHYLDIELKGIDENGKEKNYKLSDFKGKNVILYFYPQDDTPVCTEEANKFKEALNKLKNFAEVIGVSANEIKDHIEFQTKHKLNFPLLSDSLNKLKEAIKEHNKEIQNIQRTTFILDKEGHIVKVWEKVDIDGHIEEIIDYFEKTH